MCGLCRTLNRILHPPGLSQAARDMPEMMDIATEFRKASTDHMANLWVRETHLLKTIRNLRCENERLRDLNHRQELHMLKHGMPMMPDEGRDPCA